MGHVYLINMVDTNFYKIGHTTRDVEVRLNELRTGNPQPLELVKFYETDNYQKLETWLHRRYRPNKKEGEWFEFDENVIYDFINECKTLDKTITLLLEQNPFYN